MATFLVADVHTGTDSSSPSDPVYGNAITLFAAIGILASFTSNQALIIPAIQRI